MSSTRISQHVNTPRAIVYAAVFTFTATPALAQSR